MPAAKPPSQINYIVGAWGQGSTGSPCSEVTCGCADHDMVVNTVCWPVRRSNCPAVNEFQSGDEQGELGVVENAALPSLSRSTDSVAS